ncbi:MULTISPECIES: molybdopterin-dependent oxidoreductase [Pseudorhizobium]|uniref:molybdopterin-dependent oxidoreductase n=1 Tax=Pseudorhizobium TaxID=1903858 RepID=UPI000496446F|nr:molybdopterin-dependent oxidoreductase [Pseudorhizobium marinum]
MHIRLLSKFFGLFAVVVSVALPAMALDAPKGPVVLTVSSPVLDHPNVGATAQFDLQMLEALAGRSAKVRTPWTSGEVEFSGPYLRSVLEAAGARGAKLRITALNDYYADVPMEDVAQLDTILATRLHGKTMSVREKGPLFLIYPFDLDPNLYNEKYFSRSVWQIVKIEVTD